MACLSDDHKKCHDKAECFTMPFWRGLADSINQYIDGYTLQDFLDLHEKSVE